MHWVNTFSRFATAPICLIMVACYFSITAPSYFSTSNAVSILAQASPLVLLAVGQSFALVTRGFDVSVGAVAALASAAAALVVNHFGLVGLIFAPVVGAMVGAVNGVLIGRLRVPPIVATLGTMIATRAIALLISNDGQAIPLGDPSSSTNLAFGTWLGLAPTVWIAVVLVLLADSLVRQFTQGRALLMFGSNPSAVALVGIKPEYVQSLAYLWCGTFAGAAGAIITLRAGAGLPIDGSGLELQSIAAAIIGGTALSGGVVSIPFVAIGAVFIQALLTGLNLSGVSPFIATCTIGVVIIAAGLIGSFVTRHNSISPR